MGVEGNSRFQHLTENLFVNYGIIGTTATFHRWSDNFGYFVVDVRKLEIGLGEYFQNKYFCRKQCKAGERRIMGLQAARRFLKIIRHEDFMLNRTQNQVETCREMEPMCN